MISSNIYGYRAHDIMENKPKYPEPNKPYWTDFHQYIDRIGKSEEHQNLED